MSQETIPNVIIFGETGVGKSSVVNMILGSDKAKVGDGARGQTFQSSVYPTEINGKFYHLYDTVGLGEHSGGTVDSAKAIRCLYQLLTNLSNGGGANLLVFVIRCGRLTETMKKNYNLFHYGFCDSKVPIVIVVTGCENAEPTMDAWWINNEESFSQAGMLFVGHACVCAFKGGRKRDGSYRNEDLFEESRELIRPLIVQHCMTTGWKKQPVSWFRRVIGFLVSLFGKANMTIYRDLYDRLANVLTASEAEAIVAAVE